MLSSVRYHLVLCWFFVVPCKNACCKVHDAGVNSAEALEGTVRTNRERTDAAEIRPGNVRQAAVCRT